MTVVVVPTLLLWVLIALFALNGAATLYKLWLQRKLDSAPKLRDITEADFRRAQRLPPREPKSGDPDWIATIDD